MDIRSTDVRIKVYCRTSDEQTLTEDDRAVFEQRNNLPGGFLTIEEERRHIVRWRERHDERAGAALIVAFAPLIEKIARRYRSDGMTIDDKIQHGRMGLLRAIDRFDLSRGTRFSTYAQFWIESKISLAAHACNSIIKLPRGQWTSLEILPMDSPGVQYELDRLGDDGAFDDGAMIDLPSRITALVEAPGVTERERRVITARYLSDNRLTLSDLAEELDISGERVRQIEASAIKKINTIKHQCIHQADTGRAELARKLTARQFHNARAFHRRFQRDLLDELVHMSRRRDVLSRKRHAEVVQFPKKDADGWIDWPPCLEAAA